MALLPLLEPAIAAPRRHRPTTSAGREFPVGPVARPRHLGDAGVTFLPRAGAAPVAYQHPDATLPPVARTARFSVLGELPTLASVLALPPLPPVPPVTFGHQFPPVPPLPAEQRHCSGS